MEHIMLGKETKLKRMNIYFKNQQRCRMSETYNFASGVEKDEYKVFVYYQKSTKMGYTNMDHIISDVVMRRNQSIRYSFIV